MSFDVRLQNSWHAWKQIIDHLWRWIYVFICGRPLELCFLKTQSSLKFVLLKPTFLPVKLKTDSYWKSRRKAEREMWEASVTSSSSSALHLCISRKKPTQFPFLYETDAYNLRPSQPCCILLLTQPNEDQILFKLFSENFFPLRRHSSGLQYGFISSNTLPNDSRPCNFSSFMCQRTEMFLCVCACVRIYIYIYIYIYIAKVTKENNLAAMNT